MVLKWQEQCLMLCLSVMLLLLMWCSFLVFLSKNIFFFLFFYCTSIYQIHSLIRPLSPHSLFVCCALIKLTHSFKMALGQWKWCSEYTFRIIIYSAKIHFESFSPWSSLWVLFESSTRSSICPQKLLLSSGGRVTKDGIVTLMTVQFV